jgi:hypothetical protein
MIGARRGGRAHTVSMLLGVAPFRACPERLTVIREGLELVCRAR